MPELRSASNIRQLMLILVCILTGWGLASCSKEPRHISQHHLADVLYDLHLAQAIAAQRSDSVDYYATLLSDAALRKHHLTREELDANLHYYTSRPEELHAVYERLVKRFDTESSDFFADNYANQGDTVNIWPPTTHLLFVNKCLNRADLNFATDTLVTDGDNLELQLVASSIYPEGERNALAYIRMEYADTTATLTRDIGGIGSQQIDLPLCDGHHLKNINITLLQNAVWSEKPKLLMFSRIHLLRVRPHQEAPEPETPADTTSVDIDTLSNSVPAVSPENIN